MAANPTLGPNERAGAASALLGAVAVFLWAALVAGPALGEVRLATAVNLVQTLMGEDGQLEQRLVEANGVAPGDELRYRISFTNTGLVPVEGGAVVITNPMPESTEYVPGSAGGEGVRILFTVEGEWSGNEGADVEAAFVPFDALTLHEGGLERPATGAEVRAVRWIYQRPLAPGDSSEVWFHLRLLPLRLSF